MSFQHLLSFESPWYVNSYWQDNSDLRVLGQQPRHKQSHHLTAR